MTKSTKKELATSFTTFLFLVISITGVLMFFHILDNFTKQIHEILGLLFVAVAGFHVVVNWKAMQNYFKKKSFIFSALSVLLVSSIFIFNAPEGESPKHQVFNKLFNAPLEKSLTFLGEDLTKSTNILLENGIKIEDAKSLKELARLNSISPFEIVSKLSN